MTRSPEAEPPRETETTLPEFPLPPDAFVGDELVEALADALDDYCSVNETDPSVVERICRHAEEWARTIQRGEPVLWGSPDKDRLALEGGGIATGPMYAASDRSGKYWHVCVPLRRLNQVGGLVETPLFTEVDSLAWDYEDPQAQSMFIVGEENVRSQLTEYCRAYDREDVTQEEVGSIATFLNLIKRTTLPIDYLGIDEPARIRLCNRLLESLITSIDYEHDRLREALIFIADIQQPEQLAALQDSIEDQWAGMLPLHPGESGDEVLEIVEQTLENHAIAPELLGGLSEQAHLDTEVRHASFMADLYLRRAAQEHARPLERTEVPLPEITGTELPEPQNLSIFSSEYLPSIKVKADIAYVRALRAANYPVRLAVGRNQERMRRGIRHLAEFAQREGDATSRLEAFDAMEYLFNIQTEPQRDELYRLLGERFALTVPLEEELNFAPHLGVAAAIGQLMPNPPKAEDGTPYTGHARTAAMMAHFYRRRAFQLLAKQLRRYKPTNTDEEDSENAEEVV